MIQLHRPRPSCTLGAERLLLLVALIASGLPIPASADIKDALPLERPDDPPGIPARAPTGARIASTIAFGRFTHIQVNVSGAGADIIGDAANEPSIAVDPTNHDRIVIGWRQFDTIASNFRQAGVGYSTDGGATWVAGKIQPGVFRSDPVLGVNATGKFFYNSLHGNLSTQVFPSLNGGATWGGATYAYGGDKQWMAIDQTGGVSDGFIHQAWSPAGSPNPSQTYNRSTNGGLSYATPSALAPFPLYWGTLDVASDGTLYVVGTEGSANVVAKSIDANNGAVTPTFTFSFVDLGGLMFPPGPNSPNPVGLLGQLWIGVDRSNGPRAGWIYVLGSIVTENDPLDVMFARSTDGGQTWSAPVRVNDDPVGNGAWQWFSTMSVAPDGRIEAVWNDSRTTGDSTMTALFYSYSDDGGVTWSTNEQASPVWNSLVGFPNQAKIGDYYHMVSDNEGADLAWSATFNGGQDVYYLRIPREGLLAVTETQRRFALHPGRPNPFHTYTTLRFDVPSAGGDVKLEVFDVGGRRVTTLEERWLPGGTHAAHWDGADAAGGAVAPGVYLCRLEVDGSIQTRRLLRVQ